MKTNHKKAYSTLRQWFLCICEMCWKT